MSSATLQSSGQFDNVGILKRAHSGGGRPGEGRGGGGGVGVGAVPQPTWIPIATEPVLMTALSRRHSLCVCWVSFTYGPFTKLLCRE